MILDERLEFADNVSVAAVASTAVIGDVIDLGGDGRDGSSEDLYLVIQTGDEEVITAGAAGTIQFDLVSDSLASLGAGVLANCTTHFSTGLMVTDDAALNDSRLNVNQVIAKVQLPKGVYERYLGILCTIATTTVTAGKINAFLTRTPPDWAAMADSEPTPA